MTKQIMAAFTRKYSDTGQYKAYVEWSDGSRTEGDATAYRMPVSTHMQALFDRAIRNGLNIKHETW